MDKKFIPSQVEEKLYRFWEENGYFKGKVDSKKKPFSIILPPPNANADLHLGHAMYVYEDVMIRYHKMKGFETLWVPGADHAGIETQYVFEKHLVKEGKSRFDYDRETLFKMIWEFVMKNKGTMENQLRRLGFALDWSKEKFTLDPDIVKIVYETFKKFYDAGLIYRAERLVNYCVRCGTSYSDLEVVYKERTDPLYYLKYGPFTLATTRPETKFGDTAVAVHPSDKRYKKWVGKEIEVEGSIGKFKLKVVADRAVDPKFGTGVVKVTPAHDFTDFEIGLRHNLPLKQVIGFNGRLNSIAGSYADLTINQARKKIAEDMKIKGLLVKVKEDYVHRIGVCYKCGGVIEPLPKEQWFIKIKPLAKQAIELIKKDKIKFYPKKFKKHTINILDNFIDWNISRQIVWGIKIPAYRCRKSQNQNPKSETKKTEEWFVSLEKPKACQICGNCEFEQDTDTFDTWFSSSQWPFATLVSCSSSKFKVQNSKLKNTNEFFNYFYPTSVMETGYDILRPWVSRMIMVGYFVTQKVPFENVYLHGMVRDKHGAKMSKSKGNVINPLEMIEKYGADALRAALIFGVGEGRDLVLSEEKIIGMRNFANKIWNIGRFIEMLSVIPTEVEGSLNQLGQRDSSTVARNDTESILKSLEKEFGQEKKKYLKYMDSFKFSKAFDLIYHFLWHRFADYYIEALKIELRNGNIKALETLKNIYLESLKLLHPFIPFVTEAIWKVFEGENKSILNELI